MRKHNIRRSGRSHLVKRACLTFTCAMVALTLKGQEVVSPNGKIHVELTMDNKQQDDSYGKQQLRVSARNGLQQEIVVPAVALGLKTTDKDWSTALTLTSVSPVRFIRDDYEMISGKRRHCTNEGSEITVVLQNKRKEPLQITIRAYNDGVAFRYQLENTQADTLLHELTSYTIENGVNKWMQAYTNDYEGFYPKRSSNPQGQWCYPALVQKTDSLYVLISEANIMRGHAGSRLDNASIEEQYSIKLGQDKLPINGTWVSPWRTLMIGSLADIVESTLITDVSEPSKIKDTHWIQPGNVAWIYWAYNHSSGDYQKVKEYTDLAAQMGWQYNLIDWKWDVMSNGGDVQDAIRYAIDKGVKPLLWYNSGTGWVGEGAPTPLDRLNTAENRAKEYQWLQDQGVAGIKIDFFDGDGAAMMNYYIDLMEDAAKFKLMVNLHGSTTPRGWSRTYPNLMTMEAVYGAEWYNNNDTLTNRAAAHNATLPFTRNVIGSMDYTPGTFSDSQHPHITSHGHELALMIAFESAWQHRPDRPSSYEALPPEVRKLLSELPAAWDDTKLLSGYPGDHIVIARRKGTKWYVAGLNGTDSPQTLLFDSTVLSSNIRDYLLINDGADPTSFHISRGDKTSINIRCLARGGFIAVLDTE